MTSIVSFFRPNPELMYDFENNTGINRRHLTVLGAALVAASIAGVFLKSFSNKQALLVGIAGVCIYTGAQQRIVGLFALPLIAGVGSFIAVNHRQILLNMMPRLIFNINLN